VGCLISVIITAYNRKEFLLEALNSVIYQTLDRNNYEIILIKNFNDITIDSFCKSNSVVTITMDGTIGEYLSKGISLSKGQVICFLDDDDLYLPNKLEEVSKLCESTNFSLLHNNYSEIDEIGNPHKPYMRKLHFTSHDFDILKFNPPFQISTLKKLLKAESDFNISCISISRSFSKSVENTIKNISACQDGFLFYSSLSSRPVVSTGMVLTKYRVHASMSNATESFEQYSNNICGDVLRQIQSLKLIRFSKNNDIALLFLERAIVLKELKLAIFDCLGISEFFIKRLRFIKTYIDAYSIFWVIAFMLKFIFGDLMKKVIYSLVRSASNSSG